jgi:predicted ABC-type ATPase
VTQARILIIAGPNGAGKTTFAREFLPQEAGCPVFLNADLIAAGLSPFAPEVAAIQAGRLMLQAMEQHVARLQRICKAPCPRCGVPPNGPGRSPSRPEPI